MVDQCRPCWVIGDIEDMVINESRESRVGGTGTEEEVGTRTSRRGMSQLWEGRARLDQVPGLEPEPSAKSPVF